MKSSPTINLNNFTPRERRQLAEISERVRIQKTERPIQELQAENILLRRLLLEAVTSMLHRRKPNDEFIEQINKVLRLEKFR